MVSGSFGAGCLEWPRAVSGCLAPAATFFHSTVPVIGCFMLCSESDEREAVSTLI
jgi:hypothetical protein